MEELGNLEGYEKNKYWGIRLPKSNFLISEGNWLYGLIWKILTLIMLIPLFILGKYYSHKLRLKNDNKEEDIMTSYRYFTPIYPGCVYSPFIKGYELELFKSCDMEGPVLEIGIGDGYFSSLLFKFKNKKLTYGADLIYGTLKSATKYDHCEKFIIMDAVQIPFPDHCFRTIIMNNLIHHLHDRSLALKEALRVLKKGGRFIFTDNTIRWGTFTWEQLLLRRLKLQPIANYILDFKLKLFAQKLLYDDHYYDKKSKEDNFRIIKKVNFGSKTSMYLSSIFEFLNLKLGQPTRREMLMWLRFFGLKNKINHYMENIIGYCHYKDRELSQIEGYAIQFYEIEKLDGRESNNVPRSTPPSYACPKCKKILKENLDSFFCEFCNIKYPFVEGIPILISYQDKLEGFFSYLEEKKKEKSEDFIT